MKRGLFIVLFIVLILFISGQQSCEPTITVGDIRANTCCKLTKDANNINCIADISQGKCDSLYSLYGNYYIQEIYQTNLPNSCTSVSNCLTSMSCKYQDSIYQDRELVCLEENDKIYQCGSGMWFVYKDCSVESCTNTNSCKNPLITTTLCSSGNCGEAGCPKNCLYSNECAETGTDQSDCGYPDSVCDRETDGNSCNAGAGTCSNGLCSVVCPLPTKVASKGVHTCALLSDKTIKCWGNNAYGQLGDGTTTDSLVPVSVSGIADAIEVAAGGGYTCALLSDGVIKCWGNNAYGQLGDGTTTDSLVPVPVSGITNAIEVEPDIFYHTCALLSDKTIKCWGRNNYGQLGDGTTTNSLVPVSVSGIADAIEVAAGAYHTCALLSDKTIKCWGANINGRLGDGTTTHSSTPVSVSGITTAIKITAGDSHTCALLSDEVIKCWGNNLYGQLGDGSIITRRTPVSVLTNAIEVTASYAYTCALLSDGVIKCWGSNTYGQLGDGTTTNSLVPVSVQGLCQ